MIVVNKKIGHTPVTFSPDFYKRALRSYQSGDLRPIIGLMEKSEIDSQVAGCLMGRRAGFLKEWRVTPASESAQDTAVAEFVTSVLWGINVRELFEDVQEARLKKFSVINLEWEILDNKQVITEAKKVNQRYFRYDDEGILKVDWGAKDLREIPEDSALVCESNRDPILLPVLRDYILKEFGLESWAGFLETFGESFILGKYPPGADAQFKTELENGINALAVSARGIMPDTAQIDIVETKRNTGDHEKFGDRCDAAISISLLGHANAVQRSAGLQVGENQEAYKVKREIALGDIFYIEEQMSRLVRMLVKRNFTVSKMPLFMIDKSEPINTSERLDVLRFFWDAGGKVDPAEFGKLGIYIYPDQEPLQKQPLNLFD